MARLQNRDQLLNLLNTPGNFGINGAQGGSLIQYVNQHPGLKDEQDYLTTTFEQLMAAQQEPFPNRLQDVSDVIHQRVAKATKQGLLLNAMFYDGLDNSVNREARCLANIRLAMTAVALEQYRAAHSQYPAALSELAPNYLDATPVDPFDGQPLHYRQQGNGYVLNCAGIGENLTFSVVTPPSL
ncbi:MAG: hypothetical protein ACLQSR_04695 [Limisphaerales bacterium]